MKVGWLIDPDMFGHYRDPLVASIRAEGHCVELIHAPQPPYRWDDAGCTYRDAFPKDACVIALGDIDLVTRIHRERRWSPGAFCTVENFVCSHYYCWLGKYLLNRDYIMLPFGELERQKEFLFRTVGNDGRVFIRPDSPLKLFTGQVARRETFSADLEFMGFYEFPENSLVVVSSVRHIENEWRFVVANRQVIAGCQYKNNGRLDCQPRYDQAALELAHAIASGDFEPDPVWVIDICRSEDTYHLLEIGGFSFADLYACDMTAIVKGVSAAAIVEWRRAQ